MLVLAGLPSVNNQVLLLTATRWFGEKHQRHKFKEHGTYIIAVALRVA
jgi:hypothetical protein